MVCAPSGPATKGITIVVAGEGLYIPRIQMDKRPVSFFQAAWPLLVILFSVS